MGNALHTTVIKDTKGSNPSVSQHFGSVPDGSSIVSYQADTVVTKDTLGKVISVTRTLNIIVPAGTEVVVHETDQIPDPTILVGHHGPGDAVRVEQNIDVIPAGTTVVGYQADRIG
jgi:hypothetical protein